MVRRPSPWTGLGLAALLMGCGTVLRAPAGVGADAPVASRSALPTVALPTDLSLPRAADGRHYPLVPADPARLAALLAEVEQAVRDPATPEAELPALGHQQQV
ncbi:MAG: hypothetical protein ACKOZW_09235, partial [Cyanobium sp.]